MNVPVGDTLVFKRGLNPTPMALAPLLKLNVRGLLKVTAVLLSFMGTEIVTIAAAESKDPSKQITKATNSVIWRIGLFYVGALFVILSIYPWNEIGTSGSPFVMTFERLGIKTAAGIINFVVITAALSSCNGGIFSTGRMLYSLAQNGQAPANFATTAKNGVPRQAFLMVEYG